MRASAFNKRIFTLVTFAASAHELFAHLDDLHAAVSQRHIARPFAEKIMLAVTQVNGCRYCSYAHTHMALQAGISDTELSDLLRGEFGHVPESELVALIFAQHYAEQADRYSAAAWQRLQDTYGSAAATAILTHIRLITFANLYGNTFDALLERLKLHPVPGSRLFDEIVVLSAGATVVPVGLFLGLIVRRWKAAMLRRKVSRVLHD
jgi:AhpD family alkylhydroperoxidase